MKKCTPLVLYWFLNSVFIYFASVIAPDNFVLGTYRYSPLAAAVLSGFVLTILVWHTKPLVSTLGLKNLKGRERMFVFYWLVNSLAIWLVARLPSAFGFGISAFYWAFVLGLAIDFAQWVLWQGCKANGLVGKRK